VCVLDQAATWSPDPCARARARGSAREREGARARERERARARGSAREREGARARERETEDKNGGRLTGGWGRTRWETRLLLTERAVTVRYALRASSRRSVSVAEG